ncbi:hypothetical protein EIP86_005331 [Pleurotus ostreatoroseus]|nr:hypothetical protein EIP86_005331 [Pleurotus ostreatoroseus]
MQLKLSLALGALVALAAATPKPQTSLGPGPFAGQMQVWSEPGFVGKNVTLTIVNGGCVKVPFTIQSIMVENRWTCNLFT